MLGLPAEQSGRVIPGILAAREASESIRENCKRQPHFTSPCATTRQRLDVGGPIRILALRGRAALKIHQAAPEESHDRADIRPTPGGCQSVESGIQDAKLP